MELQPHLDLARGAAAVRACASETAVRGGGGWAPPASSVAEAHAARGDRQWVYGEVTGCAALLGALLGGGGGGEAAGDGADAGDGDAGDDGPPLFVDVGSGSGRICLFAAAAGLHSVGLEIVAARHAAAVAAKARLLSAAPAAPDGSESNFAEAAARLDLVLGDAFDPPVSSAAMRRARWVCCNNAVWGAGLNRRLAKLVSPTSCPRLAALATTRKLPPRSCVRHGLRLARASAVAVSWDADVEWPLFVYVRDRKSAVGEAEEEGEETDDNSDADDEEREMCVATDEKYNRMMVARADALAAIAEPALRLAAALRLCEMSPYLHASPHVAHLRDIFA